MQNPYLEMGRQANGILHRINACLSIGKNLSLNRPMLNKMTAFKQINQGSDRLFFITRLRFVL